MNAIDIDSGRKKNYSDQRDINNDLVCARPNICPSLSFLYVIDVFIIEHRGRNVYWK